MPGMELTSKAIEEAEFRTAFRGYDVEQVDDFLEQVAAGVEALTKRLEALSDNGAGTAPRDQRGGTRTRDRTTGAARAGSSLDRREHRRAPSHPHLGAADR